MHHRFRSWTMKHHFRSPVTGFLAASAILVTILGSGLSGCGVTSDDDDADDLFRIADLEGNWRHDPTITFSDSIRLFIDMHGVLTGYNYTSQETCRATLSIISTTKGFAAGPGRFDSLDANWRLNWEEFRDQLRGFIRQVDPDTLLGILDLYRYTP